MSLDQALGQLDICANAFRRIEPAGDTVPPAASGQAHFIAVLKGDGALAGPDGPLAVAAGQLLLLPNSVAPQPGAGMVVAHGLLRATLLDGRNLFDHIRLPHRLDASGTELFTGAIPELLRESACDGPGSQAIVTCLARRLVTVLVRDAWPEAGSLLPSNIATRRERLGRIVDLMKKDPGRDYTLDALADAAALSRTLFHREFVSVYGMTPLAMLRTLRLKRAQDLLCLTEMPIKTITVRLGYRSRSHFCKIFKHAFGLEPEQFRTRHQDLSAWPAPHA